MQKLLTMIAAAAVAIGAVLPMSAFADTAALSVTVSGNDVSVSAAAGVLDDTSVLYIVWDTEDRGTSLADWPAENRIVYSGSPAISSAAATYTLNKADVPNGAYMRVIATSDVRLIGGYVALKANQYINTGIKDTEAYGLDIRYRPLGTSSGSYSSLMGGVRDKFTIGMNASNYDKYYINYNRTGNTAATGVVGNPAYALPDKTNPHTLCISDGKLYLDDKEVTTNPSGSALGKMSGAVGQDNVDILLGVTWNDSEGTLNGRYCHAEWYYATLPDANGNALVNLVPALCGDTATPEAVFYDTVSGKCFANAGTGTLACSGVETNRVAIAAAATESLYNGRVATWTGGGDASDATDSDNWSVTDMGIPVADAIPANGTKIAGCTLAANADWSALAATGTWIQPVEYVDVAAGAYIDTEFNPNQATRIVMDITVQSEREYWFGAMTNSFKSGVFCAANDKDGYLYTGFGNAGDSDSNKAVPNESRVTIDYYGGVFKKNGVTVTTRTYASDFQLDRSLYLFCQNRYNSKNPETPNPYCPGTQVIRFHSCQIYDNGTLVRDYVPVTVGGGVKIYDRKNAELVEFKKKAGTETVTSGAASGGRLGGDVIEINGTIDLAGHTLTVGDLAGEGTITDTVGGGELHISVGSGLCVENTAIALVGSLKLVKEGAGTLVGAKSGQTYTGGTLVSGGRAKCAVADRPWGAALSLVTIADGATFDWAGAFTRTGSAYNFAVAGSGTDGNGALVSTVLSDTWNVSTIADMELLGDALIGGYGGWGFSNVNGSGTAHTLTMNGHTLSISLKGSGTNNTGMFAFRSVTTSGTGTISFVNAMSSRVYPSFFGSASDLSSVTLDLGVGYSINAEVAPTIGTFIDRRSVEGTQIRPTYAITVLDCFKPMTTNLVRTVTLGDATHLSPVLDLSALDGPFVLPSANYSIGMASGATVQIKLGERKGTSRVPIITWTDEKPAWVDSLRFTKGDSGRRYGIAVKGDGIYVYTGLIISIF